MAKCLSLIAGMQLFLALNTLWFCNTLKKNEVSKHPFIVTPDIGQFVCPKSFWQYQWCEYFSNGEYFFSTI